MKLRITSNPGMRDFPDLASDLPKVGDVRDFPQDVADRLVRRGVAVEAEAVQGVAKDAEVTGVTESTKKGRKS